MTQLVSPPSDSISELLRALSVRSTIFCISELNAPWAFRVEGGEAAKFHLVLEGSALLLHDGHAPVVLRRGSLVVLAHGAAHTLADDHASPAISLEQLLAEHPLQGSRLRYGGVGPTTRILCGGFKLAENVSDSTLALFPDVLRVDNHDDGAAPWLEPILATLDAEAKASRPGTSAIIGKLADVFLAQALRSWLLDVEDRSVVSANVLNDRSVAKALNALISAPAEPWSLDGLAKHVGLSRSALAIRFRDRVGEPPMRYLTKVRLRQAAAHLATGRLTIHEIAGLTGYHNDAALSKAFKREFGLAPGRYREEAHQPPRIEIT